MCLSFVCDGGPYIVGCYVANVRLEIFYIRKRQLMHLVVQDAVFQAAGAGQEQLGALDRFAKKRKLDG